MKSVDNKFKSMSVFKNLPKLVELYLQNNQIPAIKDYEGLTSLKKLNLRHNKIDKMEEGLPELPALEYLNLRSNKIANLDDCLHLFAAAPLLTDLNLLNNPCELQYSSMNILICTFLNLHRGK